MIRQGIQPTLQASDEQGRHTYLSSTCSTIQTVKPRRVFARMARQTPFSYGSTASIRQNRVQVQSSQPGRSATDCWACTRRAYGGFSREAKNVHWGEMELPLPFPAGPASAGDATKQKTSSMPLRVQEQHRKFQKRRIVCRKRRRIALAAEPFRQRPNLRRFWSMRDLLCVKSTISPCRGGSSLLGLERAYRLSDDRRHLTHRGI